MERQQYLAFAHNHRLRPALVVIPGAPASTQHFRGSAADSRAWGVDHQMTVFGLLLSAATPLAFTTVFICALPKFASRAVITFPFASKSVANDGAVIVDDDTK
jgi:hypothetical protein